MRNDVESQAEWRQLSELYRAMSDAELLHMAARPGDLTETAQDALRAEMESRRLQPASDEPAVGSPFAKPNYELRSTRAVAKGMVPLMTFYDAIAAREACDCLEQEGLEIDVRDVSTKDSGGSFYGGPAVALQVIVRGDDLDHAVRILREKMSLFPLQEVEGDDVPVDDGALATLGSFGRREDADEVARALEDAHIWHRIGTNSEGSIETEDCYTLEVKEINLVKAGEVVEKTLQLPEA